MVKRLLNNSAYFICSIFFAALLLAPFHRLNAQCGPFASMKQQRISGINVGAGGYFSGLLQWLPSDYSTNLSKRYPVIIYFGGQGANGDGSQTGLCTLITDQQSSLPWKIENGEIRNSFTVSGTTYSYIFISAQFTSYIGGQEHKSAEVDALINYVNSHYRVDSSRIYLTGMSAGANLVMDYVASSLAHAHRIAAATMASLCYDTTFMPSGPATIAAATLPLWLVHCQVDAPCTISIPDNWVNKINTFNPNPAPVYQRLPGWVSGPDPLDMCHFSFPHDTWRSLYDTTYTAAAGLNSYQFNLQFDRSAILPLELKSFTARLSDGKVYLRWVTTDEKSNTFFTLQRAGSNQDFTPIATFKGTNLAGENIYEYTDDKPLPDLSYYRIKETAPDGRQQYFSVRKVLYKTTFSRLAIISPNPFRSDLSVFINLPKTQKVALSLADMNGKILVSMNGLYAEGTSEISIPASGLARGVYFLTVQAENKSEVHKIIKQ